jgi:hypothetical protein
MRDSLLTLDYLRDRLVSTIISPFAIQSPPSFGAHICPTELTLPQQLYQLTEGVKKAHSINVVAAYRATGMSVMQSPMLFRKSLFLLLFSLAIAVSTHAWAANDASISGVIVPGTLYVGQTGWAVITMKNTGTTTWTTAGGFALGAVGDSDPFVDAQVWGRQIVPNDVPPGQEISFTTPLNAQTDDKPSQVTDWRMVQGSTWFGATVTRTIPVADPIYEADSSYVLGLHSHDWTRDFLNLAPPVEKTYLRNARICVRWDWCEPSKNVFNWTQLDSEVQIARNNGVQHILLLIGFPNPDWAIDRSRFLAGGAPPKDIMDWEYFCGQLAAHCKGNGYYYEILQEPGWDLNSPPYLETGQCYFAGDAKTEYLPFLQHAYTAIKANDATSSVVCGALMSDLSYDYDTDFATYNANLAQGLANYCDYIGCHPYYHWSFWGLYIRYLRSSLTAYGAGTKKIMSTEIGTPNIVSNPVTDVTEDQRQGIQQGIALLLNEGVRQIFIYEDIDDPPPLLDMNFGLMDYQGNPHPAWNEYKNYQNLFTKIAQPVTSVEWLKVAPAYSHVVLSWLSPHNRQVTGTVIRYKTTGWPTGPSDGALLLDVPGGNDTVGAYTHLGLTNGQTYYYAAFTYNAQRQYSSGVLNCAVPNELMAPVGPITSFTVTPNGTSNTLSWTNPADVTFTGTVVRFRTDSYPISPADGYSACYRTAAPGSTDSFAHTGANSALTYYYSAWGYNGGSIYSSTAALGTTAVLPDRISESLDTYAVGGVGGQGGWGTVGASGAQVESSAAKGGVGNAIVMDTIASTNSIASQISFADKAGGYYYLTFDVAQDAAGTTGQEIGSVSVYGSSSTTEIARVHIQKGRLFVEYGSGSLALLTQSASNLAWYNVRIGLNVNTRKMDLWLDGVSKGSNYAWKGLGTNLSKIVISSDRNTSLTPQKVYLDNLKFEPATSLPDWINDSFDSYSNGNLGNQGGWTTTRVSGGQVQSSLTKGGTGKAALMDTASGLPVANQISFTEKTSGYCYVSFDVAQDAAGTLGQEIACVSVYGSSSLSDIAKVHIQKGRIFVDYGSGSLALLNASVSNSTWYNVKIGFNIDTRKMDFWLDGASRGVNFAWKGTGYTISRMVLSSDTNVALSPRKVYIDNIRLEPAPAVVAAVRDDGVWSPSLDRLHFSFDGAPGASEYHYAIGTTSGGTQTRTWTSCGTATDVTAAGLSLAENSTYYISVQCANLYGTWGTSKTSDGIKVAPALTSIYAAKTQADGISSSARSLRGKLVSAVFPDCFYIQEPRPGYCGIKVISSASVALGDMVDVAGFMTGSTAERAIDCTGNAVMRSTPGPGGPYPLGMNNPTVGGGAINASSPGVIGGTGPNNIGTLVTVFGKVTQRQTSDPAYFYVDDGSCLKDGTTTGSAENAGVRILLDPMNYPAGTYVAVKGVVSCFNNNGLRPQIRATAIQTLRAAP